MQFFSQGYVNIEEKIAVENHFCAHISAVVGVTASD